MNKAGKKSKAFLKLIDDDDDDDDDDDGDDDGNHSDNDGDDMRIRKRLFFAISMIS